MGARAEPQTLSAAIGSAGQGGVRIHVHPETPFAKTEAWIDENVDQDKRPRAKVDAIRLIHDSRPVRLRLLSGHNGKLCVIYHNEEQDVRPCYCGNALLRQFGALPRQDGRQRATV